MKKKYLMLALILVTLVACGPSQELQPTATRRVVRPTANKTTINYATLEALLATPVPDAPSMILKMHEAGYDFWERDGDYQWMCDNKFCGCVFPSSVKQITCGMTYDNPNIPQFEKDSVNIFLVFGVPDDAIMAIHNAQVQARTVPADVLVEVSGSVGDWELLYTDDPDSQSLNTSFWRIQ